MTSACANATARSARGCDAAPATEGPALRDRILVCLASDYDFDPTGKHHIMRELARTNRVLWVNYHGSRRPKLTGADVMKSLRTLFRAAQGSRPVSESLTHFTPVVIPGAFRPGLRAVNRTLLRAQIQARLRDRVGVTASAPVQVWSFAPDVGFLRGALNEEAFIYYCVDEFGAFEGYDAEAIRRQERELLVSADVVFASSEPLADARRAIRPDIRLARHGVEYAHFARAWRGPWPTPADLKDIDGCVFGFFGLIGDWVDVELLAETARLRPQHHFVLLGECRADAGPLRKLSNVRLLGRKPYADLPAYCARFCAGLLPFCRNDLTRNVNPIKLREYLAAGLPVISTPMPETERYAPHVRIATDAPSFAAACDAVAAPRTRADAERISRRVAEEDWSGVVRGLCRVVVEALDRRASGLADAAAPAGSLTRSAARSPAAPGIAVTAES
ncbi:MAG: hypothetical protein FLDDKLPJ_02296 [Phycisphaerae bacterium]|nr:hypothetical protein [Phycisphaerae bacterium]